MRELIDDLRARLGRRLPLESRMDWAFCSPGAFRLLAARGCGGAIEVGLWHWLPLTQLAAECQAWQPIAPRLLHLLHAQGRLGVGRSSLTPAVKGGKINARVGLKVPAADLTGAPWAL